MSQDVLGEMIDCDGVDHAVSINCVLLYVVEGLLPLLSALCKQLGCYYMVVLTNKAYSRVLTPQAINILVTVGSSLAVS